MKTENKQKKRSILMAIALFLICWFSGLIRGFYVGVRMAITDWHDRKLTTSPLPAETQTDLCKVLQLSENDKLCDPQNKVYARGFYSRFRKLFRSDKNAEWTYNYVSELIGSYEVNKEDLIYLKEEDRYYFTANYNFLGYDDYTMMLFFTEDGKLYDVRFSK